MNKFMQICFSIFNVLVIYVFVKNGLSYLIGTDHLFSVQNRTVNIVFGIFGLIAAVMYYTVTISFYVQKLGKNKK